MTKIIVLFYRGTNFRKQFGKLGDLRGFFPPSLKFMALTATASKATRKDVIRTLGMVKPVTIVISPEKKNIVYYVNEKSGELEEIFRYLVEELRSNRTETMKTIVFCRTYQDCSNLYLFFKDSLKEEMTDPVGYVNISRFRLVDMFTACNTKGIKNSILTLTVG